MKLDWHRIKLAMFDLDGTLAKSKQPMTATNLRLLAALTQKMPVVVIGGGKKELFWRQVVRPINRFTPDLRNLLIMPTNGAALYIWQGRWLKRYSLFLTRAEVRRIRAALKTAIAHIGLKPPKRPYGHLVENRGAQITFSALGQEAPLSAKLKWNRENDLRPQLLKELQRFLPDFKIQIGGLTSIDITRRGIDKSYAILRMQKYFRIKKDEMVFIGDAIYPGGNDYPVTKTGIPYLKVKCPTETRSVIERLLGV